ncbi:hypothetical protein INR79_25845 [Vibrio sp. SCSIO 43132]|uniref:GNAT family N-acetyltransferase n=1 Tax=Vibrio sp. SCSIO 43132 TaxID=2779363 RepID=UPI001CA7E4E3|nr:GNAT family N-acetyltransferase [Vibrio sp. SCSIO 43132]UAB72680.1 hypothetical protein INR79_25845 [Vibrio sp. SCSIO 43132]
MDIKIINYETKWLEKCLDIYHFFDKKRNTNLRINGIFNRYEFSEEKIRFRNRYLIIDTLDNVLAILDLREKKYSQLGAKCIFSNQNPQKANYSKILNQMILFLSNTNIHKVRINTMPNNIELNENLREYGFKSKIKLERVRYPNNKLCKNLNLEPSNYKYSIHTDLDNVDQLEYVKLVNDFYGVSCIDLKWLKKNSPTNKLHSIYLLITCHDINDNLVGFLSSYIGYPNESCIMQENTFVISTHRGKGIASNLKSMLINYNGNSSKYIITHNNFDDNSMDKISEKYSFVRSETYMSWALNIKGNCDGKI